MTVKCDATRRDAGSPATVPMAAEATGFSDLVCGNVTRCSDAEFESVPLTLRSDRTCTTLRVCHANGEETNAATPISDRSCECSSGYWGNGTSCFAWMECAPDGAEFLDGHNDFARGVNFDAPSKLMDFPSIFMKI